MRSSNNYLVVGSFIIHLVIALISRYLIILYFVAYKMNNVEELQTIIRSLGDYSRPLSRTALIPPVRIHTQLIIQ